MPWISWLLQCIYIQTYKNVVREEGHQVPSNPPFRYRPGLAGLVSLAWALRGLFLVTLWIFSDCEVLYFRMCFFMYEEYFLKYTWLALNFRYFLLKSFHISSHKCLRFPRILLIGGRGGGVASLSHFLIETASKRRRPELSDASWHLNHPIIKWISIFLIIIIIILILLIITH